METTSTNTGNFVSFKTVLERLSSVYGVDMRDDIVQLHLFDAMRELGGVATSQSIAIVEVKDFRSPAPCNAYHIKSITQPTGLHSLTPIYGVEAQNYVNRPFGKFVDYVWEGEDIKYNLREGQVVIEYSSIKVNEEGDIIFPERFEKAFTFFVLKEHDYAKWRSRQVSADVYQETMRIYEAEKLKVSARLHNRNELDKAIRQMYSFNNSRYLY